MRKIVLLFPLCLLLALSLLPGALEASHCQVSTHCSDGSLISCNGSSNCSSSNGQWVECDGKRTNCPTDCTADILCPDGQTYRSCTGNSPDSCIEDSCMVICDGQRYPCPGYETVLLCPA